MKNLICFLFLLLLFSCENDLNVQESEGKEIASIFDEEQNVQLFYSSGKIQTDYIEQAKGGIFDTTSIKSHIVEEGVGLRAGGTLPNVVYTLYGGDKIKRRYLRTEKIGFTNSPGYPQLNGYYLADVYEYYLTIEVPKGATVTEPKWSLQDKTNMGRRVSKPSNKQELEPGYTCNGIKNTGSNAGTVDLWEFRTYVWEINYNIIGQQNNRYLYPISAKRPDLFKFQYFYTIGIVW